MPPTDFSQESSILGKDFNSRIEKIGGKGAGLELLQEFLHRWRRSYAFPDAEAHKPKKHYDYQDQFLLPQFYTLGTETSKRLKEKVTAKNYSKKQRDFLIENTIKNNRQVQTCLEHVISKEVPLTAFGKPLMHVRTSTTIEDWKSAEYSGVFQSLQVERSPDALLDAIIDNYKDFFAKLLSPVYNLPSDTEAGMVLMDSAKILYRGELFCSDIRAHHATLFSSYPEVATKELIFESMRVTPEHIRRGRAKTGALELSEHARATDKYVRTRVPKGTSKREEAANPFSVDNGRSFLHADTYREYYAFTQYLEKSLGKEVNLEAIVVQTQEYTQTDFVQLRPVPKIPDYSPLQPPENNYIVLAETPFVEGVYEFEIPVLYGHKGSFASHFGVHFPVGKPVAAVADWNKAYRSFEEDGDLKLVVYRGGHKAINHGFIEERTFENKSYWNSMGVEEWNHDFSFLDFFSDVHYGGRPYKETPVPLRFESDGRQGRISVNKNYLPQLFQTCRENKEKELAQQKNQKNFDPDDLPF